jgi:hypothetical protein
MWGFIHFSLMAWNAAAPAMVGLRARGKAQMTPLPAFF